MTMRTAAAVVAAIASLVLGVTPGHAAPQAAGEAKEPVSWTIRPSDGTSADGRTWIQLELDPGVTVEDHAIVTNLSDVPAQFRLTAADGFLTDSGHFNMLPSNRESVDAGAWITLGQESVSLDAGASAVVPFTLTVPENAAPGDHPAGIAASVLSSSTTDAGANMGVESRVGFRVMTQVTGELSPGVDVTQIGADYRLSWDLFRPGAVEVDYAVKNAGNTRLIVTTQESAGGSAAINEPVEVELLPGGERKIDATITKVWPFVFTTLEIRARAVVPGGQVDPPDEVIREIVVWTIPWPWLLVALGLATVTVAIFWRRRRRDLKVEELIAAAREDATRSALDSMSSGRKNP
jgi:hypothetical protein